ncbi:tetratricopeptide repeat protein [Streptomyces sp. TX20-6-3]|uniref:tetratricopeptide repeat protein n=1 Tax=Streptomyces sp. TX20-6-3 TaxID=3028705 RepID=UPI0029BB9AFD|nr:tetratricopeptide repeat protein [Streptomyces sp. TX20-6-3]MDX2565306.1 tetratricopeptide repeat protein [Streptomyces sp. TX20-6-3]
MTLMDEPSQQVQELLEQCLQALDSRDDFSARDLIQRAEAIAATAGPLAVANTALISGMVEQSVGDTAAASRRFQEAAAHTRHQLADPDGVCLYLEACTLLGALHRSQGQYDQAERVLHSALTHTEGAPAYPLDLAAVYNELGVAGKYAGRFDQAAHSYRQALALLQATLSPDDLRLATLYHNLGGLAYARGDYKAAEKPARLAVAIREESLGPSHPDVAADRAALAPILFELGQTDEAEHLLREALAVFEDFYGPEHYETAITLSNLAAIVQDRDDTTEAETCYQRAVAILETVLGPRHPDLAPVLHNLAHLRRRRNDHDSAHALNERARALLQDAVQPGHPTLTAINDAMAEKQT